MVGDHIGDCTYENAYCSSMVGDHFGDCTYVNALISSMVGDHIGDCTHENALITSMVGDHSCGWTYVYALIYDMVGDQTHGWTYEYVDISVYDTWIIGFYQWCHLMIQMFYENHRRKFALCKLSQNSTQPDIHVDVVFAIYIHHSVICQYIKLYWPLVAAYSILQVCQTMSKDFRLGSRVYNQHVFACGTWRWWGSM